MKPTREEKDALAVRMEAERKRLGISYSALGAGVGVDPGQVSRICRGEFATFSDSVVRICRYLGLQVFDETRGAQCLGAPRPDPSWAKLQRALRKAWDKTPEGADLLARVLSAVADVVKR